jgi:Mg2+ and Co2+ transporter CorA
MSEKLIKEIPLGEVYILENEAMPNIVKIGYTQIGAEERAIELSKSTGVPLPFDVAESFLVEKPERVERVERVIHLHLEKYRINNKREFFKISKSSAYSEIGFILYQTKNIREIRQKQITSIINISFKYPQCFGNRSKKEILTLLLEPIVDREGKQAVTDAIHNLL